MQNTFFCGRWTYKSSGDEVSYTNWHPGQPNGRNQDCISVDYPTINFKWVDEECWDNKQFVCEFFECNCDLEGSASLKCDVNGDCSCKKGFKGRKCDSKINLLESGSMTPNIRALGHQCIL